MKPQSIQDLHPIEIVLVFILLIAATILNLCTPSPVGNKKPQSKELNGLPDGITVTPSSKVNPSPSPSTKSGTSTVDQKKADGPSSAVTPSKPSASSPSRRRSGFSTNSTKSTTRKSTTTKRTTSV